MALEMIIPTEVSFISFWEPLLCGPRWWDGQREPVRGSAESIKVFPLRSEMDPQHFCQSLLDARGKEALESQHWSSRVWGLSKSGEETMGCEVWADSRLRGGREAEDLSGPFRNSQASDESPEFLPVFPEMMPPSYNHPSLQPAGISSVPFDQLLPVTPGGTNVYPQMKNSLSLDTPHFSRHFNFGSSKFLWVIVQWIFFIHTRYRSYCNVTNGYFYNMHICL